MSIRHKLLTDNRLFYLISLLCLQAACSGIPVQELSDARQSVYAAREVSVEKAEQRRLQVAEAFLQKAEKAMKAGDYSKARRSAIRARVLALQVQKSAWPEPGHRF